ncbi:MAG: aminoglycoside phosphotransferase family protein [Myxococcales bacterium]
MQPSLPAGLQRTIEKWVGRHRHLIPIRGGQHSTYRVVGRRSAIVKVFPADHVGFHVERRTLQLLAGRRGIPHLYASGKNASFAFLLVSCIAGESIAHAFSTAGFPRARALTNASEKLARTHELLRGLSPRQQRSFPVDSLAEISTSVTSFMDAFSSAALNAERFLGARRLRDVLKVVHRHAPLLVQVHEHRQVIHGDYQPRNVLADQEGRIRGVVDWEMARQATPLCDIAMLLRYCDSVRAERDVLLAYAGLSLSANEARLAARCYDLAKVTLGMSKAPAWTSDARTWIHYIDGCLDYVRRGSTARSRRAARDLLLYQSEGQAQAQVEPRARPQRALARASALRSSPGA